MHSDLIFKLKSLAEKYETSAFLEKDPSQFMHRFTNPIEQELVAFIAASLSFGRREQILSHIQLILDECKNHVLEWTINGYYNDFFTQGDKSFYRMFTHNQLKTFFNQLSLFIKSHGSLGKYFRSLYEKQSACNPDIYLHQVICSCFPNECSLIPHTAATSAKRVNMFLRWMVRDNSPVDLGLWNWYKKSRLLMPLDTHVMQEATSLEILEPSANGKPKSASLKTAVELTKKMSVVFPDDPVKADFALFGLGVDN